jgi:fatty-acid peroxygenase
VNVCRKGAKGRSAALAVAGSVGAVAAAVRVVSTDRTSAMLREGYEFIPNRTLRQGTDILDTRLLLRKAVCVTGRDAAETFYRPGRFTRRGAMPTSTMRLLQDQGSVQTLDGEVFRRRKSMFMSLMGPQSVRRLADLVADRWHARLAEWERRERVVLYAEVSEILCRAGCAWTGVELPESEAPRRTRELTAMIEGAGSAGPRMWRGLLLRARAERWMRDVVQKVRSGEIEVAEDSPVRVIAFHRDGDGNPLSTKVAAVEMLNLLRPIVAIARFVTFAALALHDHPGLRPHLRDGDDHTERFVQEVRRFYPFFPFVGGRVRNEFEWAGRHFPEGTWVILDLYGTNRASRSWEDPDEFRPERFRHGEAGPFELVPQGGGDHYLDHRCAGEWATIEVLKRSVRLLVGSMTYDVPEQDLTISRSTMPTMPASGFVISGVRRVPEHSRPTR